MRKIEPILGVTGLMIDGKPLRGYQPIPMRTVAYLMDITHRDVTREELGAAVWPRKTYVPMTNITVAVSMARKLIKDERINATIKDSRNKTYRWVWSSR